MGVGNVTSAIGSMQEYVRPELAPLMLSSSKLWKRFKVNQNVKAVSVRPSRIPFFPYDGGKFRASADGFNGASMGRGSGPTETFGTLSCVGFSQCSEYTALSGYSTDSDEKAIENYVTLTQTRATKTFAGYLDAIVNTSDGSNTLDTVVSAVADGLIVNNADYFNDNQDIDCYSSLGGQAAFIATVTILSIDIQQNTIWLTGPVPAGVTAGTLLLVAGSPGVQNSGLAGLRSYLVGGNAGSFMGIQRSSFPGKFSTPTIAANGSITPALARALESQITQALGDDADTNDVVAHCNVDQAAAWENVGLLVQSVIRNEVKGDNSVDMLAKKAPKTLAGRELMVDVRARPGLVDFIPFNNFFRIETKPLDMYDVGGQTMFPTYGQDGGLATSIIFYYNYLVQIGMDAPRKAATLSSLTIPKNYFNH